MRDLTFDEVGFVSGAETHDIFVIDPIAAIQTFLILISVADQQSFVYGSVVTGMTIGAIGAGIGGGTAVTGMAGLALGIGAGIGCAAVGAVAGGLAFKAGATFAVGAYNWIMS